MSVDELLPDAKELSIDVCPVYSKLVEFDA
jgi:hypothetical protein